MVDPAELYDRLYQTGYRSRLNGYEQARWDALAHFLTRVVRAGEARRVLDYGCGAGGFVPLWQAVFPQAELLFCEVSAVALDKLQQTYPDYRDRCVLVRSGRAELPDAIADLVVSVEVMEHVADLDAYLQDIARLLRPGGTFVWTTPCANPWSIEHLYNVLTGQIERTPAEELRWKWEDVTHLRRLRSAEVRERLLRIGFAEVSFRFRAHFFSFVCSRYLSRLLPERINERLMHLDYTWFRRLPNGASMIGAARKAGRLSNSNP